MALLYGKVKTDSESLASPFLRMLGDSGSLICISAPNG